MTAITDDRPAATSANPLATPRHTGFVLLMSHLTWIRWVWAAILVLLPIALVVSGLRGAELTESLWAGAGIGWQRWILFAAGVTVATTFLREFVTRGVTRRRLAEAAIVAMVGISVLCAAVAIVGYVEEWAVFRWQDWPQQVQSGGEFGVGSIPRLAAEYAVLGAIYHLAGWLVGAAWSRHRWPQAIAFIPLCFVPVAVVELCVSRSTGNFEIDALPDPIRDPAIATTLIAAAAVIAATTWVAGRVTRGLELR